MELTYRARSLAAEFAVLQILSGRGEVSYVALKEALCHCEQELAEAGFDFAHWAQADLSEVLYRLASCHALALEGSPDLEMEPRAWRSQVLLLGPQGAEYRDLAGKAAHEIGQQMVKVLNHYHPSGELAGVR